MRAKRISRRLGTLVCAIGLLACSVSSTAATYVKSPPWVDIFASQWNDLDTRQAAWNFSSHFSSDYQHYVDLNFTAHTAIGSAYAGSDAVWVTFGHGSPGDITYCNPPNGATCTSVLWANASDPGANCSATPNDCVVNPPQAIGKMLLMIFAGCHTGVDGNPGGTRGGNLLKVAVNSEGVTTAVGFDDLVYWPMGDLWGSKMGTYLGNGQTVSDALVAATVDIANKYGSLYGWGSFRVVGNGNLSVIPARYGS